MHARSWHFMASGGIGGGIGFALMEFSNGVIPAGDTRWLDVLAMAGYFAGFGLAVGAALGMTEGFVRKQAKMLRYGIVVGAVLGLAGGFIGGGLGQVIYGLVPGKNKVGSPSDIAIALDSSTSMGGWLFFGNDPRGKRKTASIKLVEKLTNQDRVAVIDFDHEAKTLLPLTRINSSQARKKAYAAINRVDSSGGTNLALGLSEAIAALSIKNPDLPNWEKRMRHIIFLTDGEGYFEPELAVRARAQGMIVHVIGLGNALSEGLLRSIAYTPDHYYPVKNADDLIETFQRILTRNINMISRDEEVAETEGPIAGIFRYLMRIISWLIVGLAIGMGQGVRENTKEDLRACSLGGLIGGAAGGALFDPLSSILTFSGGLIGRALGGIVVGASIGGSMRMVQKKLVMDSGREPTTFLKILPRSSGLVITDIEAGSDGYHNSVAASTGQNDVEVETELKRNTLLPQRPEPNGRRKPLSFFRSRYHDPSEAMRQAFQSGHYEIEDIADFFESSPEFVIQVLQT